MDRHQEESSTRLSVTQLRCNSNGEKTAVKYHCCGSGMLITDPAFYPSWIPDPGSRIPDPKTATKNFWRIFEVFTQNFSLCSQIYEFGIRDPGKTYSGSRIQYPGAKRHRIPDPQHCKILYTDMHPCYRRQASCVRQPHPVCVLHGRHDTKTSGSPVRRFFYVIRVPSSGPRRGFELTSSRVGVRHSDQLAS